MTFVNEIHVNIINFPYAKHHLYSASLDNNYDNDYQLNVSTRSSYHRSNRGCTKIV